MRKLDAESPIFRALKYGVAFALFCALGLLLTAALGLALDFLFDTDSRITLQRSDWGSIFPTQPLDWWLRRFLYISALFGSLGFVMGFMTGLGAAYARKQDELRQYVVVAFFATLFSGACSLLFFLSLRDAPNDAANDLPQISLFMFIFFAVLLFICTFAEKRSARKGTKE